MFAEMRFAGAQRCLALADEASGLRAIIALDSLTLGPAVGGVRTQHYGSDAEAMADAASLARAMTLKCAIAGLEAGGAKTVVIDHPGLKRTEAFRLLGRHVQDLGGLYRCAGDLGTTPEDLRAMALETEFVNTNDQDLAEAAGRGVMRCIEACVGKRGGRGVNGVKVVVQGCGSMGSATARALAAGGAEVIVTDIDTEKARSIAAEIGGSAIAPEQAFRVDADIISPCAMGGIITEEVAEGLRAWAICGAANNQLRTSSAEGALRSRGIMYVPDFLASAGAAIAGIAPAGEAGRLIDGLGDTATRVMEGADAEGRPAAAIAEEIAWSRIRSRARGELEPA